MFVINGGTFACSSPIWGHLCDKLLNGKAITVAGAVLSLTAFLFMGPASVLPLPTIYGVCIATLVLQGCGVSAQLVAGFAVAHRSAVSKGGFDDSIDTYALVSGLWTSLYAFGAFIGPCVAGLLVDHVGGFRAASLFVVFTQLFVILCTVTHFIYQNERLLRTRHGYQPL